MTGKEAAEEAYKVFFEAIQTDRIYTDMPTEKLQDACYRAGYLEGFYAVIHEGNKFDDMEAMEFEGGLLARWYDQLWGEHYQRIPPPYFQRQENRLGKRGKEGRNVL